VDNPDKHLLAKIGQYVLIANNDNQVLMLQRQRSKNWSLPGGRLNKDDRDWKVALIREIVEETALMVEDLKPFDIKLIEDVYQTKYCVYFIANCSNIGSFKISQEHVASRWVNKNDIDKMIIDDEPKVRQVLEQFFSH